jgi:hypothetical protein
MDSRKRSKDEATFTGVAESIGSTLGTIAAKAGAVQKALTHRVAEARPRVRRAAKRAAAKVEKRTRSRIKRARKNRVAAGSRRSRRKF